MKWLDRALIISPYCYGLCLTEKDFHAQMVRLELPKHEWPEWQPKDAGATTHTFQHVDGKRIAIVTVNMEAAKDKPAILIYALLVHEAVHIWQHVCDFLGEHNPSPEFEAYSIQCISQELMFAWEELTEPNPKRKTTVQSKQTTQSDEE